MGGSVVGGFTVQHCEASVRFRYLLVVRLSGDSVCIYLLICIIYTNCKRQLVFTSRRSKMETCLPGIRSVCVSFKLWAAICNDFKHTSTNLEMSALPSRVITRHNYGCCDLTCMTSEVPLSCFDSLCVSSELYQP